MQVSKKTAIATLWIFVMFNYLYCDLLTLMDPKTLKEIMTGRVGNIEITQTFLLGSAILMEIPIAMVLLSRVLKHKTNRIANIVAGAIMTIVQISSLFFGTAPTSYYVFFSIIEATCTASIVYLALKWSKP